ncbi:hypothetical protein C8R43DRAFT_1235196 [Mycena crocata]|nr:hypothetical protein C8R43DRAFT_1235196 [Mycena crocata]
MLFVGPRPRRPEHRRACIHVCVPIECSAGASKTRAYLPPHRPPRPLTQYCPDKSYCPYPPFYNRHVAHGILGVAPVIVISLPPTESSRWAQRTTYISCIRAPTSAPGAHSFTADTDSNAFPASVLLRKPYFAL